MSVNPIPQGYHSVTPYLIVDGAESAIDFYIRAFAAEEILRLPMPGADGAEKIAHAEVRIGNSMVMLADEFPDMDILGPKSRGGATASLMIYTEDCDATFARAVAEGATAEKPPEDQFYGDRSGTLVDPFGHRWTIATHVEDLSEEEIGRRMAEWSADQGG